MEISRLIQWGCMGVVFALLAGPACNQQPETQPAMPNNDLINSKVLSGKTNPAREGRPAYRPGVLLVKFENHGLIADKFFFDAAMAEMGIEKSLVRFSSGIEVVKITGDENVLQAADRLKKDPRIDIAEPDWRIELLEHPNDPMFAEQWHLHNTGQNSGREDADIDAPEAWDLASNQLEEIIVAVVDSGVDTKHPDLVANIWNNTPEQEGLDGIDDDQNGFIDDLQGWNFVEKNNDVSDTNNHGTHCAGLIGATGNNEALVTGVAWKSKVKIMPVRIIGSEASHGFVSDAAQAIDYAVKMKAKIINCSWWTKGKKSKTLQEAITSAQNQGVVVVAAAGDHRLDNDRNNLDVYPAEYENPNVISVAATDNLDRPASFTNWGTASVDIAAPGVDILSTSSRKKPSDPPTAIKSGTSASSSIVAGAIATLLQQQPDLVAETGSSAYDYQGLRDTLFLSVDSIPGLQKKIQSAGRINLHRALMLARGQNLSPVALAGGDQLVRVGASVQIDAGGSFDPNGDAVTGFDWKLKKPDRSQAQLEIDGSLARFVPDVCGSYEVILEVSTQTEVSSPDVATILAMNWQQLEPAIETEHPYPLTTFETIGEIKKPKATLLIPHFKAFDTEFDWDYIVLYDPKTESILDYLSGPRGGFDGPILNVDHVVVNLMSQDAIINDFGIIIDSFSWCNEHESCPPGMSDCDLDSQTGQAGCEIDTRTDPLHCGWCGHVCSNNATGAVCNLGACDSSKMTCLEGYADCNQESYDGCEIHPADDPNHCGTCQNACDLPNVEHHGCVEGSCAIIMCRDDPVNALVFADCNSSSEDGCEVNTHTDPEHCGGCGKNCSLMDVTDLANVAGTTGVCFNANCTLECKPGWYDCNQRQEDGCESDLTDRFNCGNCGNLCHFPLAQSICADPENGVCEMGACISGFEDCDQNPKNGCETAILSDLLNCGVCQRQCLSEDNAQADCILGSCIQICHPGYVDCDKKSDNGCEIHVLTDADNCGACEQACGPYVNATGSCVDATCHMVCNFPFFDCDGSIESGCEIDTSQDPLHCGRCRDACQAADNAQPLCTQAQCTLACNPGYADCDNDPTNGCETNLQENHEHCGKCWKKCPKRAHATSVCTTGLCGLQCEEGWKDCNQNELDGCEGRLDDQGRCPKNEGGCTTANPSESGYPFMIMILLGLAWLRRRT